MPFRRISTQKPVLIATAPHVIEYVQRILYFSLLSVFEVSAPKSFLFFSFRFPLSVLDKKKKTQNILNNTLNIEKSIKEFRNFVDRYFRGPQAASEVTHTYRARLLFDPSPLNS
jgi:hypothetical protein